MIYEHLRGDSSPWKPYLDILPAEFDTLMFWTEEEVKQLQASSIIPRIGRAQANEMIRTKVIPKVNAHRNIYYQDDAKVLEDDDLLQLAHRVGSIIMAYAFNLETDNDDEGDEQDGWIEDRDEKVDMGMVPMADILNADAQFNVSHRIYRRFSRLAHLTYSEAGPYQPRRRRPDRYFTP
jgi:N-lysine methyltransferase SETD6